MFKQLILVLALMSTPVVAAPPKNVDFQCQYILHFFEDVPLLITQGLNEDQFIIGWEGNETQSEMQTWLDAKHMFFQGVPAKTVEQWCHGKHVDGYQDAWQ